MELGLKDKVAIVTGGSYGIGRAAAWRMADEGANVAICARRGDILEEAAADIQARTQGTVLPIQADVSLPEDIERVVSTTLDRFGRLDILVNNAGQADARPFESVTDEEWQADFDLKLFAAIRFRPGRRPPHAQGRGREDHQRHQPGSQGARGQLGPHLGIQGRWGGRHQGFSPRTWPRITSSSPPSV